MASVFLKRGRYWARLRGDKQPGKWSSVPTGETDRAAALEFAEAAQRAIDKRKTPADRMTLRMWIEVWSVLRAQAVHDWRKDLGRLENHVTPMLGDLELTAITTKHIADLVRELRFVKRKAPRTVRNVYIVLSAVLRDAAVDGKIATSPCILTETQLGSIVDKDPEWRGGALFTRDEANTLISDPRIPLDRRVVYAYGLLAGLRPGEGAALRWRNYDPSTKPLGKLTVALAYSTPNSKTKSTKTNAVRIVPVHPTFAALLAELRYGGWKAMMGNDPTPDDLITPIPPDVKLRKRTGERFRGYDYTGKRWREIDLPMLGWRARSVYDTKSTFITLAIDDGADRAILRDRVTHTKPRRDAFDGYDRGVHWAETCREVAKLRIGRLATTCDQPQDPHDTMQILGSEGGDRTPESAHTCTPGEHARTRSRGVGVPACDFGMQIMDHVVAKSCDRETEDE